MSNRLPPRLADRAATEISAALAANRRGYVPGWTAADDAGIALHAALARNLEIQGAGLNAAPLGLQLAFLESLGANLLPAQPARAPIVFTLLDNASADMAVGAGSRLGAVLPPRAPSLDGSSSVQPSAPPEFFTEQAITAMRGTLAALYSIDPLADTYADHSLATPGDFSVFAPAAPVPHRMYFGHAALFSLTGVAEIELAFTFGPTSGAEAVRSGQRPLLLDWEYLSADGWLPLVLVEDGTARFTRDGKIVLHKRPGPDSKAEAIGGITNHWIRATVSARTPAARIVGASASADAQGLYAVEVESSIEIQAGDVVTCDGDARASVRHVFGNSLRLDAPPAGAETGEYLVLADVLPPLRAEGSDEEGSLPQLDVVRVRVGFAQAGLALDRAFLDSAALDISKDLYPFGEQPRAFAALYLACKSAFPRTGARIELAFTYSQIYPEYAEGTASAPALQAEFYSAGRWLPLGSDHEYADLTEALTSTTPPSATSGVIAFVCPDGWDESEINGEKQRWLRLRLLSGDYGRPLSIGVEPDPNDSTKFVVNSSPATLRPPIVASVAVSYVYFTNPAPAEHCLCENDFAFVDRSEQARWPRRPFQPIVPVADRAPALHFGFSAKPPTALVSLLVHVLAAAPEGDAQPFVWDYWGSGGWAELSVRDTTAGLRRTGLVQFVGAADAMPRDGLGGALYRVRARLKSGLASQQQVLRCGGVWLNAVWASHGQRSERELLGLSNGNPDQTFALAALRGPTPPAEAAAASQAATLEQALDRAPSGVAVQAGEVIEVREWTGRGEDWQTVVASVPEADLRFEVDPRDPAVRTAAWVRWHAQPHLYCSGQADRHYVVERASGVFRFPGAAGFIPPAGSAIVVSYVTGGGVAGNVAAGTIRELRSSVGFIQAVSNPLPSEGGAGAESLRAARDRAVQSARHRDRAVSTQDYEWLARAASSEVARARALALEGPNGRGSAGFVGIVLVPHSLEARPLPSDQLAQTVLQFLTPRVPAGIAGGLRIVTPSYVAVSVRADIQALVIEEAATVEARVRTSLLQFLHPINGGVDGRGWDFGSGVYLSQLATRLAAIEGVAAVELLQLRAGQANCGDVVAIEPQQLVCAGELQLKIVVPSVPYALA